MAVTSVNIIPAEVEAKWNRLWQREYQIVRRVECDTVTDGPVVIRTATSGGAPLLPQIGAKYFLSAAEQDVGSFLSEVTYRREFAGDSPTGVKAVWLVTEQYTPYDANMFPADPTQWAIRVTFGGTRVEKILLFDRDGNAIVNSAKFPFQDPATADDSRSSLTIERNELCSAFDLTLAETYRDTLNLAAWNGFAAETVKCGIITTSQPQYDSNNQVWYYTVTYPFEVNRSGWKYKPADRGFVYVDGSGKYQEVLDDQGQRVSDPVPLNGSGGLLAVGGTLVTLSFNVYDAIDWSGLNLDLSTRLGA